LAWTRVCRTDEVDPGEAIRIELDPPIAVFNVDGEHLVTADTCTHQEASLADGYIEGDTVECPAHFAQFCLRDGRVLGPPAPRPIRVYPVRIEDGEVLVDLSELAPSGSPDRPGDPVERDRRGVS
jgi:nitrite reductase/ring-hydroxylating ferredoxin subunit